jgi:hypothetical protein
MRKPRFKVPIQDNAHSNTTTNLHSSKTRKIDEEQSRAINVLEITELKLGIAIREKDSFLIAMALLDTEKIINQVEKKYRETARFESLMRRCEEAKNFLDRYIP